MKHILTLAIILFATVLYGQKNDCKCLEDYDFVVSYLEQNLPGYSDNVNAQNIQSYTSFKKKIRKNIQKDKNASNCIRYLMNYINFFKDNHTSIRGKSVQVDEDDEASVNQFIKGETFSNTELIDVDASYFKNQKLDPIEGIYHSISGSYKIGVLKSKTSIRDYAGVILESTSKLWKKGQVKIEIKKNKDGSFDGYLKLRNHSLVFLSDINVKNGITTAWGGWQKIGSDGNPQLNYMTKDAGDLNFKIIEDSIAYLRIPTFAGYMFSKIDSVYKASFPEIKKNPYLIIDVRNNGGGSDNNVKPLLELIYNEPMDFGPNDGGYYVTAENINAYKKRREVMLKDASSFGKESIDWINEHISKLEKASLNSFLYFDEKKEPYQIKLEPVNNTPKKVVILYNRGCASSCETLVMYGQKSSKSVLVGENSGGFTGYGDVLPVETPQMGYRLQCTRARWAKEFRSYEKVGITPDVKLKNDKDWLNQTIEWLKSSTP